MNKTELIAGKIETASARSAIREWFRLKTEAFGFAISKTERRLAWILLSPAIVILAMIGVFPAAYSGWLSMTNMNLARPQTSSLRVGFANWEQVLRSLDFWNSFATTMIFLVIAVSIEFVLGLAIALVFAGRLRNKFLRTIMLIPMIMAPVVIGLSYYYMFDGYFGLIPWVLRYVGLLGQVAPLGTASLALLSVIMVDIWQWTPFIVLILLAGLESFPAAPYEAAQVDNASRWMIFTRITLPLLRPVILIAVLLRVVDAFRIFDKIYVLTGGGPASTTDVLSIWIYRKSFLRFNVCVGATASLIMLYIALIICVFLYTVLVTKGTQMRNR